MSENYTPMSRIMRGMNIATIQSVLDDLAKSDLTSNDVKEAAWQAKFIIEQVTKMLEISHTSKPEAILEKMIHDKFLKPE